MSTKPINIRIDPATDSKLDEAARISGLPKADIMRFALAVGLKDLEAIGFDITAAIHAQVATVKTTPDAIGKQHAAIGFHHDAQSKLAGRVRGTLKPKNPATKRA